MKSSPLNWTCYCLRRRCIGVEKSIANHCKTTNAYYWLGLIWAAIRCIAGFATCSDSLIFACACLLSSYTCIEDNIMIDIWVNKTVKYATWCSLAYVEHNWEKSLRLIEFLLLTFVSKYTQLLKIYFWCSEALGIGPSVVFHIRHTEMFCFYCLYCEVVLFVCMLCAIVILFFYCCHCMHIWTLAWPVGWKRARSRLCCKWLARFESEINKVLVLASE